jgi:hypothetical protein
MTSITAPADQSPYKLIPAASRQNFMPDSM